MKDFLITLTAMMIAFALLLAIHRWELHNYLMGISGVLVFGWVHDHLKYKSKWQFEPSQSKHETHPPRRTAQLSRYPVIILTAITTACLLLIDNQTLDPFSKYILCVVILNWSYRAIRETKHLKTNDSNTEKT